MREIVIRPEVQKHSDVAAGDNKIRESNARLWASAGNRVSEIDRDTRRTEAALSAIDRDQLASCNIGRHTSHEPLDCACQLLRRRRRNKKLMHASSHCAQQEACVGGRPGCDYREIRVLPDFTLQREQLDWLHV